MKIGINTLLWTADFTQAHFPLMDQAKEMGFDGVEIASFDLAKLPAAALRRHAESVGVEITSCSALIGSQSLITDDAAIRQHTLEILRVAIAKTAEMGASILVGPFLSAVGYVPGRRRTEDEWQRGIDGLRQLGAALDEYNVTLAVEPLNRFETFILNTAHDANALCEAVNHPRVGILFDTFHANIEERDIATACRLLGKHLRHFHACENDRGAPGSGHIEWSEVFSALRDISYDGWLVIESFGSQIPEIAAAACIWRDLAPSAEALAEEGLRFLQAATRSARQ